MIDTIAALARATPWSWLLAAGCAGFLLGLGGILTIEDRQRQPIAYWCAWTNIGVNVLTIALSIRGLLRL